MNIWVVIVAAGQGRRLKKFISQKKQYLSFNNRPLFWHSITPLSYIPSIKGVVFVFPKEDIPYLTESVKKYALEDHFLLEYKITHGGERRQDSVYQGLMSLPHDCTHVLIHDGARPFLTSDLVNRIVFELKSGVEAVIPGILVNDTIKLVSESGVTTLPREKLRAIQTPQGFTKQLIVSAHEYAKKNNITGTDDASLVEALGCDVKIIDGEPQNIKITNPQDLQFIMEREQVRNCVGFGYDVHKYGIGKPLKLAGVKIPNAPGIIAHSDGDVVVHSLVDAILGCLAKGDIGDLFPDTDDRFKDLNSMIFLSEVMEIAKKEGFTIEHVDVTIICQVPKISPYKREMKKNLAHLLSITMDQINISATTEEGLGFTGEKKGIKVKTIVFGKKRISK